MNKSSPIIVHQEKHAGFITLNRPSSLNALNHSMAQQLIEQLTIWAKDDSIHCVIVKSSEPKAFCAGGDIRQLYEATHVNESKINDFFADEYRLNHLIHYYPKPYIAFIDGITMGGGVGISIHGTYRIATSQVSIAMPETRIGLIPDVGSSYLLNQCSGKMGLYLGLTGDRMNAEDALHYQWIDHLIERDRWDAVIEDLLSVEKSKSYNYQLAVQLKKHHQTITELSPLSQKQLVIDRLFSEPSLEAVLYQLNAHPQPWAQETAALLRKRSPTSLKLTWEALQTSQSMSLAECLQMEYRLATRLAQQHDFKEGIRALLIDKDNDPHWYPKKLEEVTQDAIDAYFLPMETGELLLEESE